MLFKLINLLIDALTEEHNKAQKAAYHSEKFEDDLRLCIAHLKNIRKYF